MYIVVDTQYLLIEINRVDPFSCTLRMQRKLCVLLFGARKMNAMPTYEARTKDLLVQDQPRQFRITQCTGRLGVTTSAPFFNIDLEYRKYCIVLSTIPFLKHRSFFVKPVL